MVKPKSLVGELKLGKIRKLDEGHTAMDEREEAHVAQSVGRYRGHNCMYHLLRPIT